MVWAARGEVAEQGVGHANQPDYLQIGDLDLKAFLHLQFKGFDYPGRLRSTTSATAKRQQASWASEFACTAAHAENAVIGCDAPAACASTARLTVRVNPKSTNFFVFCSWSQSGCSVAQDSAMQFQNENVASVSAPASCTSAWVSNGEHVVDRCKRADASLLSTSCATQVASQVR